MDIVIKKEDIENNNIPTIEQAEADMDEERYNTLIKSVQAGYQCSRGKARRIIKSILLRSAKKAAKQKRS